MSADPALSELQELIGCLLNGTLTPKQHQRLEVMLDSNPAAQDLYFAQIDLHLALQRTFTEPPEPLSAAQHSGRLSWSNATARKSLRKSCRVTLLRRIGLAASILLLLSVSWWWKWKSVPPANPAEVQVSEVGGPQITPSPQSAWAGARLIQSADAEFLREYVPQINSILEQHHQYVLVKGMLELEFGGGARTILEAPAVFEISSSEQLNLKIGNCSVYAPEGAQGFQIVTPRNRVVDLGTRFSLSVNDFGHSEVQVVEGIAQVHQSESDHAETVKILRQGEATRCLGFGQKAQEIDFNPKSYHRHLPDRVMSYEAEVFEQGPGVRDLTSVTVQRGGRIYTYPVDQLIGIDLIHFKAHSNRNSVASDQEHLTNIEELITRDRALNTGLINFDRRLDAPDHHAVHEDYRQQPGMAVKFQQPLLNDPGPDVVLFEIQSVVYPAEGDHFQVSPLKPGHGLHPHLVKKFDITLNSRSAQEVAPFRVFTFNVVPKSAQDVLQSIPRSSRGGSMSLPFYALAVGIDLSDLGYPEGAEVDGLFFEDANHDSFIVIDPVFIAGFPSISETPQAQKFTTR